MRKTGWCFRPGPTQPSLYNHRRWLEAGNFGSRKKRDCTICVAKMKADLRLVFAYAKDRFSPDAPHFLLSHCAAGSQCVV